MFSTRKLSGFLLAAGALALVGCNSQPMQQAQDRWDGFRHDFVARERPSEQRVDPVMVDAPADKATEIRGWDTSTFYYPNGATLAYPTYGLNYEDRPQWLQNDYLYSLVAPAILVYDILAMPVYMIVEPPGTAVTYHGVRTPPTMTMANPLATPMPYHQDVAPVPVEPAPQPTVPDTSSKSEQPLPVPTESQAK